MQADVRWPTYDLIFFDCDSTLSSIEGIDELARFKGKEQRVGVLTEKAMNGDLDLSEVYGKRLRAIRPTKGELKAIEEKYWQTMVPDALAVVTALRLVGKQVFIVSGGLAEPVRGFGKRLGVPQENIRAVEVEYNELSGDWWQYHEPESQHSKMYLDYDEGPLTISTGKPAIIQALAAGKHGRKMMIGDGASDLAARPMVDLFIGYGGIVTREKVLAGADAFIHINSLAPILPLALGPAGHKHLADTPYAAVYERGLQYIRDAAVTLKDSERGVAFEKAFETS
jgi:phosphoserine phosphatase